MSANPRTFRANVSSAARLICDDGSEIPCVVQNISLQGAKIEFDPHAAVPEEFVIVSDDLCLNMDAWIIWRLGDRAGVRFLNPIAIGSL